MQRLGNADVFHFKKGKLKLDSYNVMHYFQHMLLLVPTGSKTGLVHATCTCICSSGSTEQSVF